MSNLSGKTEKEVKIRTNITISPRQKQMAKQHKICISKVVQEALDNIFKEYKGVDSVEHI